MRIEIYIDDSTTPLETIVPPERFKLDSTKLVDGPHTIKFQAIGDDGEVSTRVVNFKVQNGPAIAVHGLVENDTLSGEVSVLANAYGSKIGDEFEPVRMETPRPVPTWAWILFLIVLAWAAGYISLTVGHRAAIETVSKAKTEEDLPSSASEGDNSWAVLGAQVYGNNCSSCHQANGSGLPGVFPPLKDNPAVLDKDPGTHILAILEGVSNKVIDGVNYATPMPPFSSILNDEEIAAVVNHERANWGNNASLVTVDQVTALRK